MASNIKVDNIQNSAGQDLFINGYPRRPGQIIEYLTSPCDGSQVTVGSGTYTFPNVTTQQGTTDAYADLTGSSIAYVPPAGTSRVIYKFDFGIYFLSDHAITHLKFFIDNVEVLNARHNKSSRYPELKYPFEWVIPIGGTANSTTGRQATWTAQKTLKMQVRRYGASNYSNLHGTVYWDGTGSTQLVVPILTIIAIT
jgi:hypothetical protein